MSEKSFEMIKEDCSDNKSNTPVSSLSFFPTPFSSSKAEPDFHELIKNENWKKIRSYLKSPKAYSLCQQTDSSNLTCLAMALAYMAPLDIIQAIYDIDPSLLSKVDSFGATALHLGCLNGASVESIEFLVRMDNDAARKVDIDHRSALHHAVYFLAVQIDEQPPSFLSSTKTRSLGANIDNMDLVRILCEVAPEMIGDADRSGNTPTDLVQVTKYRSEVDSEKYYRLDCLYQVLKEASIKLYKDNKRAWEAQDVASRRAAVNIMDNHDSRMTVNSSTYSMSTISDAGTKPGT